jgi:hypothetical protein
MATATIITLDQFNHAQAIVSKVLGTGINPETDEVYTDYGYGQTLQSTQLVSDVTGEELNKLRTDILIAAYHQQGPSASTLVPAVATVSGGATTYTINAPISQAIIAATIGLVAGKPGTIDVNKLKFFTGTNSKTGTAVLYNTPLATDIEWNTTSTHTSVLTFASADAMRWYFNTGSNIQITPSRTGTVTTKNTAWSSLLTGVGTLTFKKSGTFSSKATTTGGGAGYNALVKAGVDTDVTIFTKRSTLKSETYIVKARLSDINAITITTTFSNTGANVSGILKNIVTAFYADRPVSETDTNEYVQVAPPSYDESSSVTLGIATPTFSVTKNPSTTSIDETGTKNTVSYTVQTHNFLGNILFYSIVKVANAANPKSEIIPDDFLDVPLTGSISVNTETGLADVLVITANEDKVTDGIDKFNIEFRATDSPDDTKLFDIVQFLGAMTINDTSKLPKVVPPTLKFASLPIGKAVLDCTEGSTVSLTITGANILPTNNTVNWKIRGAGTNTADITGTDFIDMAADASFLMPESNTYVLEFQIANDSDILDSSGNKIYEKAESFIVDLYLTDPATKTVHTKPDASSYIIRIAADALPAIPYTVEAVASQMTEGSKTGVEVTIRTPFLPAGQRKVWYQIFPASNTNDITEKDFTDGKLSGFVDIVMTGNSGVGKFTKYAVSKDSVEGQEGFYVDFYEDAGQLKKINTSVMYMYINENTPYTITRSAPSMAEPLIGKTDKLTEVTVTLNTPFFANDPPTTVSWEIQAVPGYGTVDATDFIGLSSLSGSSPIVDNKVNVVLQANDDGTTEGTEQVIVVFTLPDNSIIKSPSVSITETVQYSISARDGITSMQEVLASEATGITFDIKTPWLPIKTPVYWEAVAINPTYKILPTDFVNGKSSGVIYVNPTTLGDNTATLTLAAVIDPDVEGNELFNVILKTGTSISTKVATSENITITEDIKYKISPSSTVLTEAGAAIKFTVTTPKVADGATVSWAINPISTGISASDFIVIDDDKTLPPQRLSGFVKIKANKGSFTIAAKADAVANSSAGTEDTERFTVSINPDEESTKDTTAEISITDVSPFIVTADVNSVKESDDVSIATTKTVNFTIYTPYLPDGTLYYKIAALGGTVAQLDFEDTSLISDSFKVVDSIGRVQLTVRGDVTREGNEAFQLEVRQYSTTGPIVKNGLSPKVTIYDTSVQGEPPPVQTATCVIATSPPNQSTVTEGSDIVFNITTTGISDSEDLNWSILSIAVTSTSGDLTEVSTGLPIMQSPNPFHVSSGSASITFHANTDLYAETGGEPFIFRVHKGGVGTIPIQRIPITIVDQTPYKIAVTRTSTEMKEQGQTGVIFSVSTPTEARSQTLQWVVVPESDSTGLSGIDFVLSGNAHPGYTFDTSTLTGTVNISSTGAGEMALYANADSIIENTERFHVVLKRQTEVDGPWVDIAGVQSPVIKIIDKTGYGMSASVSGTPLESPYVVPAGSTIDYTLYTPVQTAASTWEWSLLGDSLPGYMNVKGTLSLTTSATSYPFSVITKSALDSDKAFTVQFKDSATGATKAIANPKVTIQLGESYSITPKLNGTATTSIADSDQLTLEVTSTTWPIYWYIVSESPAVIDTSDFGTNSTQPLYGKLVKPASGNLSTFKLPFVKRATKVGPKQFYVILSKTLSSGSIPAAVTGGTSATVTKSESATYSISSTAAPTNSVAEQTAVIFTVNTPYVSTNKTYTYNVVSTDGITSVFASGSGVVSTGTNMVGTFTIAPPGVGYFTITVGDDTIDNTRHYSIRIKDETGATVIETTDTAKGNSPIQIMSVTDFQITTSSLTSNVMEGTSITFSIARPKSSSITTLRWKAIPADGSSDFNPATHLSVKTDAAKFGTVDYKKSSRTPTVNGVAYSNFEFSVTATKDTPLVRGNNTNRTFKLAIYKTDGTAITVGSPNPTVTITDFEFMSVVEKLDGVAVASTVAPQINETSPGNVITFDVATPAADNGHALSWEIISYTANVKPENLGLTAYKGDTDNVTDGLLTFTITAAPDSLTNSPKKSFQVKFTSKVDTSRTITSRAIIIADTSKTPPPETYHTTDSQSTIVAPSINENGTGTSITFTVSTKTADNNHPLYWRIKSNPAVSYIIKEHFTVWPTEAGVDFTGLAGMIPSGNVANKTATLVVTASEDKTVPASKLPKSFWVEFSTTSTFPTTIDPGLKSRTIIINDTAKPDPVRPSILISIQYAPTPATFIVGNSFDVECMVSPIPEGDEEPGDIGATSSYVAPNLANLQISWAVLAQGVGSIAKTAVTATGVISSDITQPQKWTSVPNPVHGSSSTGAVYCNVPLTIKTDTCGTFRVLFTAIDPSTKEVISAVSPYILIVHPTVTLPAITKTTQYLVPANVNLLEVTLVSGGGEGGGPEITGTGRPGHAGGVGSSASFSLEVKSGKHVYFKFVPGSYGSKKYATELSRGGVGGTGIIVAHGTTDPTNRAAVILAGAGGGATGEWSTLIQSSIPQSSSSITSRMFKDGAPSTTFSTNYGLGGAGGCGGIHVGTNNAGLSYIQSSVTYNPTGGGAGGTGGALTVITKTYAPVPNPSSIWCQFMKDYAIYDPAVPLKNSTSKFAFYDVPIFPNTMKSSYVVRYAADDSAKIVINNKSYSTSSHKVFVEETITMPSNWNRVITIECRHAADLYTTGVAVTIRLVGLPHTPENILWSTLSLAKIFTNPNVRGQPGGPASAVISYQQQCPGETAGLGSKIYRSSQVWKVPSNVKQITLWGIGGGGRSWHGRAKHNGADDMYLYVGGVASSVANHRIYVEPDSIVTMEIGTGGSGCYDKNTADGTETSVYITPPFGKKALVFTCAAGPGYHLNASAPTANTTFGSYGTRGNTVQGTTTQANMGRGVITNNYVGFINGALGRIDSMPYLTYREYYVAGKYTQFAEYNPIITLPMEFSSLGKTTVQPMAGLSNESGLVAITATDKLATPQTIVVYDSTTLDYDSTIRIGLVGLEFTVTTTDINSIMTITGLPAGGALGISFPSATVAMLVYFGPYPASNTSLTITFKAGAFIGGKTTGIINLSKTITLSRVSSPRLSAAAQYTYDGTFACGSVLSTQMYGTDDTVDPVDGVYKIECQMTDSITSTEISSKSYWFSWASYDGSSYVDNTTTETSTPQFKRFYYGEKGNANLRITHVNGVSKTYTASVGLDFPVDTTTN